MSVIFLKVRAAIGEADGSRDETRLAMSLIIAEAGTMGTWGSLDMLSSFVYVFNLP